MPNTYTQIYIQIVFAVQGRQNLIINKNREVLQKYITGIVQHRHHKMLAIYCMPDHVHLLIDFKPATSISDLVRDIKAVSSKFINEHGWIPGKFNWQEGFGAFSYSGGQLDNVIRYILNQEEHHKRVAFLEEYVELLKDYKIDYDPKYLFERIE